MRCPAASGGAREELSEFPLLCSLHREERRKKEPAPEAEPQDVF